MREEGNRKRSGRRRKKRRVLEASVHKDKVSCVCTCLVSKSNIFHSSPFLLVFSSFLSMFYYRKIDKYATYFIQQLYDIFIFCYPQENVFFTSQSSHQKRENGDLAVTRSLIAKSHTLQRLDTVKLVRRPPNAALDIRRAPGVVAGRRPFAADGGACISSDNCHCGQRTALFLRRRGQGRREDWCTSVPFYVLQILILISRDVVLLCRSIWRVVRRRLHRHRPK